MKSKDIRKEKNGNELKITHFKDGKMTYYVFYNSKSAQVKVDRNNSFVLLSTYKVNSKKKWFNVDNHRIPDSIKEEVERLFP